MSANTFKHKFSDKNSQNTFSYLNIHIHDQIFRKQQSTTTLNRQFFFSATKQRRSWFKISALSRCCCCCVMSFFLVAVVYCCCRAFFFFFLSPSSPLLSKRLDKPVFVLRVFHYFRVCYCFVWSLISSRQILVSYRLFTDFR